MQASSSATPTSETGRALRPADRGELRLGEVIGSGRHGVVLQAKHRVTNTAEMSDVAVKVPTDGQSLANEAAALKRFDHPHIVTLLDGPLDNGAIILEFCGRGSLADRAEPLTAAEASTALRQVGSALSSMHAEGWMHGDVSLNNIAIRHDGTLALIDLSTARPANGEPLTEGTAELAGLHRTARPELDLRCLAAAVLSALPDPTFDATVAVDIRKQRQALMSVIERSNAGELVVFADLFATTPINDVEFASQPRRITGGPKGPTTQEFGPRPGGGGEEESDEAPTKLNRATILIIGALLAVSTLASVLFERTNAEPTAAESLASVEDSVIGHISATASLEEASVQWKNGVATRDTASGPVTYAVGIPGDLGAIGDWNCNGTPTLGVYRPSTGSWFAFDSWESSSASAVQQLTPGQASLAVAHTAGGCQQPFVA